MWRSIWIGADVVPRLPTRDRGDIGLLNRMLDRAIPVSRSISLSGTRLVVPEQRSVVEGFMPEGSSCEIFSVGREEKSKNVRGIERSGAIFLRSQCCRRSRKHTRYNI